MNFSMETPDQENARLVKVETVTTGQPTLVDGAKSVMPNLYPDHNVNPGSALLAVNKDPNADPVLKAEITVAADEKYMVKPKSEVEEPLHDGHVELKEDLNKEYSGKKENFFKMLQNNVDILLSKIKGEKNDLKALAGYEIMHIGGFLKPEDLPNLEKNSDYEKLRAFADIQARISSNAYYAKQNNDFVDGRGESYSYYRDEVTDGNEYSGSEYLEGIDIVPSIDKFNESVKALNLSVDRIKAKEAKDRV